MHETHERNALVWAVARPSRLAQLLVLLVLASFCLACGVDVGSPTAPCMMTPAELEMLELLQCNAEALGLRGEVTLELFDEERTIGGDRSRGIIICQTWPQNGRDAGPVACWRPWINGETPYPSGRSEKLWAAGHEVCHMSGIWDEAEANACNEALHASGVCR